MKKLVSLIMTGLLLTAFLSGCGSKVDMSFPKTGQPLKAISVRKDDRDDTNILIVYYSSSGTTEKVAEMIAEATGGDLFRLTPTEPYSTADLNYNDKDSRVVKEYENSDLRDVELEYNTVVGWDSYDAIFIGYPIWWGNASWTVNSFMQLNDFEEKTIIPFCTSASSGIDDSEEFLKKQADSGTWEKGKRFSANASSDEIMEWTKGLGLGE